MAASKVVQRRLTIKKFRDQLRLKDKSGFWKGVDALLRHPVTLLVIGFALTAFVGGCIQDRQQELEKDRIQINNTQDSLQKIRRSITEYALRGKLVWIHRDQPTEKATALAKLDEALVEAISTVTSEFAVVMRSLPPGSARRMEGWHLGELSKFLSSSSVPISRLLTLQPEPLNPNAPVAWDNPISDPVSYYMNRLTNCTDGMLTPYEWALEMDFAERPAYINATWDYVLAIFSEEGEGRKKYAREPDCPLYGKK
ncbi:hypothetical protein [Caballeronia sp. AZ1_KS37]|uniref:hypothetical protein n=1 Tax=Caballeronia sp. AZ1_KS37 TaxID=2921756 RepID=UPI0020284990|nr:hypothetical protein [Caballeronia sp. AZ1_KS37]